MITVELMEGYFFEIEGRDYILKKRVAAKPVVKDGEVIKEAGITEKFIGYYGSLDGLIKRYLQEVQSSVGERHCNSIKEYAEMVEELNRKAVRDVCEVLRKGD